MIHDGRTASLWRLLYDELGAGAAQTSCCPGAAMRGKVLRELRGRGG